MTTEDYIQATTGAALFDVSDTAKILLTGPDAPQFLHNISTNDVKDLPLGGGCPLFFCDARARALFIGRVYHVRMDGNHALWLETTPGRGEALLKHLDRFLIADAVELADVTEQYAQFHLCGPKSKAVLKSALAATVPDLADGQHMERTFGSSAMASVRRHDWLGLPGYDIVCAKDKADGIRRMLTAAGAAIGSPETREILRIEAGTPVYGVDIDETRFVMEVGGASKAVSYEKGCFPGQEPIVMARDRAGRVNRSFLGLRVHSENTIPAGSPLTKDGQEVGIVTSSTISPRLGGPLALGYVHWKHVERGTALNAETPTGPVPVEVLGFPPV